MDDYDEQLTGGTPPDLTEEELLRLQAEQEEENARLQEIKEDLAELESGQVQTPKPVATAPKQEIEQQPQQQSEQEPKQQQEEQPEEDREGPDRFGFLPPALAEITTAPGAGIADFAVDAFNLVTRQEVPKIPEFQNEIAQTIRELSSIVIPTVVFSGAGSVALGRAAIASKSKILADPFIKWAGNTAFSAGTGAAVDYTVEFNQTDDNMTGTLKKTWPRTYGWIPDNIATLDTDSPDVKRAKNTTEGMGLGIGLDVFAGAVRLLKALRGIDRATQWVPESELAEKYFKDNVDFDLSPEETVEAGAAARSVDLDDLGEYNVGKTTDPDSAVFGYHDMFDYTESGNRTADSLGIVGAAKDAAQISLNLDTTYGRVGSVMTEGALKFGLESVGNQDVIIKGLAQGLVESDNFGYKTASGKYLTSKQIKEIGGNYADAFYEMDLQELQRVIRPIEGSSIQYIDGNTKTPALTDEGYAGVMGAMKKYMDDFINMDEAKAQAYVATSLAGQASDMAQGMRLMEGTAAIGRAQEQILDRVEFLMAQKGMTSYVRGRALNMLNLWDRMTTKGSKAFDMAEATRLDNLIKNEKNTTLRAMERIKQESAETIATLREIQQTQPEMLAPLMMAYELTDGNVKTMSALNNYVKQSTGVINKAFIDQNPEIPSVVLKGFYSNLYNSTLSALATPVKAGISAGHLLIEKPVRTAVGALVGGDRATIRRGIYQFKNLQEAVVKSTEYMNQVFKRSATDPYVIDARDDLGLKNQAQVDVLNAFADGKAAQGEYGPQAMMQMVNDMNDLANHPYLRFGTRAMQAFDGFTQSMVAFSEARGKAFDEITKKGIDDFDAKKADDLGKEIYSQMFNENGIITDKAVKHTAGEISMNLDSAGNTALSNAINRLPVLKPFLLFTKTPLNELKLSMSYHPSNPMHIFLKDKSAFARPFEEVSKAEVEELLGARGIDINAYNVKAKYNEIRADLKGRQAIGNIVLGSSVALFMNDRITGNGIYNRQKQNVRSRTSLPKRSIKGLDGKWYSYDGLGPITNWLALTTDIMDNMDTLDPYDIEQLLKKSTFILAASVVDKTHMAGLEPFMDVARGDVGAINRWGSSFLSASAIRGSSQMAELGRLFDPGLKVVRNDLDAMIQNRLPIAKGQLPAQYDWIDGGEVGIPDNFFARVWNTYLPWKVRGEMSPEKEFLHQVEFDATPNFQTDGRGNKLPAAVISQITNYMGENSLFRDGIRRVMAYNNNGKNFRKRYRQAQFEGLSPEVNELDSVHADLRKELSSAIRIALDSSPELTEIQRKAAVQETVGEYLKAGDIEGAKQYLDYMERNFSY